MIVRYCTCCSHVFKINSIKDIPNKCPDCKMSIGTKLEIKQIKEEIELNV
jgi:Zn finger protein HypA/HybF involved in hydrogenase expression